MDLDLRTRHAADRLGRLTRAGLICGSVLAMLVACATPTGPLQPLAGAPASPPVPLPEARPKPPPAPEPALAAESRWLTALFGATPVRVMDEAGGQVSLQVPMAHAFDGAGNEPKPALRAVLDRVTQSLLRQPAARLEISAPPPSARGVALRTHVTRQGIAAWRVSTMTTGAAETSSVGLRLVPGAAAVKRLDDASLPSAGPGNVMPPPRPVPVGAAPRRP